MRSLNYIALASLLTAQVVLARRGAKPSSVPQTKLTEIKPENAKNGIQKLVENGFLTPTIENNERVSQILQRARRLDQENEKRMVSGQPRGQASQRKGRAGDVQLRRSVRNSAGDAGRRQAQGYQRSSNIADTTRHQRTDDWYDDYFEYYDDFYGAEEGDDYYYGKGGYYGGSSGKGSKSAKSKSKGVEKSSKKAKSSKASKKAKGKGKGGKGYDDDYYPSPGTDDAVSGGEFMYEIQGFIDTRNADDPIYADPSAPDEYAAGNVFVYVDTPIWEINGVEAAPLIGLTQGTCTRIDPLAPDDASYTGRALCSLTLEALVGSDVVASLTAEGTVANGDNEDFDSSILTIKGGLGEFAGVTGMIVLTSALLTSTSPPYPMPDFTVDLLSESDGFIMYGVLISSVEIAVLEDDAVGDDMAADDFFGDDLFGDDLFTDDGAVEDDFFADDFFGDDDVTFDDAVTVDDMQGDDGGVGAIVQCPGLDQADFCDCSSDCVNFPDTRCSCTDAQACCGFDAT